MKKIAIILSILIGLSSFSIAQNGRLKGKVTDQNSGKLIKSATVFLLAKGISITSTKTNSSGIFVIENIPASTYSVKFVCADYKKVIKNNIKITAAKTAYLNVKMISTKKEVEVIVMDDMEVREEKILCSPSLRVSKMNRKGWGSVSGGYYSIKDALVHNTESYDKISENVFKEVENDPLSTFSIDVDRAAYSNVRRFINSNQMPYKDAVRIEEMINYFDYDYPQPKDEHPFSVGLEMGKCPWNKKHELVMVGIQGEDVQAQNIPASNLVFLIDVSGSMGSQNKLPLLKQAFKILVNNLRPRDKVAIVVYAGAAGTVLESTSGKYKEKIIASLDNLQSGGSTAGGAGIKLAYKIAKKNFIQKGNNRVILATDGDFNVGASSNGEMVRLIEEKRDDGVFLSILGFGMGNYKDSKMEQISNAGNGNYAYIDNILEAKKVFGKELWGTLYTIAKDVKIQIEFNPSQVKAYRLVGYENRILNKEDFNDDKKDAGDIGSGHSVTAIYEIIRAGSNEKTTNVDPLEYQKITKGGSKNLMTLKLRYKKPNENVSKLIVRKIIAKKITKSKMSDNYIFASAVAEFAMLLRDSKFKKSSSYAHVLSQAKSAKGTDPDGLRAEFIKLVETVELMGK